MSLNHQPDIPENQQAIEFSEAQAQLPSSNPSVVQASEKPETETQTAETDQTADSQNKEIEYHKFGFNKQEPNASPTVDPLTFASICVLVGGAVLISNPHIFKPRPIFEASSANTAEAIDVNQFRSASNIPRLNSFDGSSDVSSNSLSNSTAGEQTPDETKVESQDLSQDIDLESTQKKERPLTQFEVGLIQAARWTPPATVATQAIPPAPVPAHSFYVQRVPPQQPPQQQNPSQEQPPQIQQPQQPSGQQSFQPPQVSPEQQAQQLAQQQALAERERRLKAQLAQREALIRQQQEQAQLRQQELLRAQQAQAQKVREDEIRRQQELQRLEQAERAAQKRRAEEARQQALAARPNPAPTPDFSPGSSLTGLPFTVGARPSEGFTVGAFQRGTATDSCLAPTAKLTPLAPPVADKDSAPVDYTQASDSLTFFVHVPATDANTAQFTFGEANSDKQLYTQVISLKPNQAEVIGIQVPRIVTAELEDKQRYLWQFALRCNESNGSNDPIARGVVEKKVADSDVPQNPTDRAVYYAKNGLWPDAISTVAQLYQQTPNDPVVLNDLRSLIRTAGLPNFVSQAPVTIY